MAVAKVEVRAEAAMAAQKAAEVRAMAEAGAH